MKNKKEIQKRPPWRPSIYSKQLVDKICARLSTGESLRSICRDKKMPDRMTVRLWLLDSDKQYFFDQYKQARDVGTEELFDEMEEIAKDSGMEVNRARLIIDTRKWYLSKVLPKKYGDKIDLTSKGESLISILDEAEADEE